MKMARIKHLMELHGLPKTFNLHDRLPRWVDGFMDKFKLGRNSRQDVYNLLEDFVVSELYITQKALLKLWLEEESKCE
jgi:hypothetical protein